MSTVHPDSGLGSILLHQCEIENILKLMMSYGKIKTASFKPLADYISFAARRK